MEENKEQPWYEKEEYEYVYDPFKFPHPNVAADFVVFGYDGSKLNVLLVKRKKDVYVGWYAIPGGFVRLKESAEEAARRELVEETKFPMIKIGKYSQFHTYSDYKRDPRERVISIAFYALSEVCEVIGGDDAEIALWKPVDEIPKLAFDHNKIIEDALKALRQNVYFEPDIFKLLPEKFTLTQVQHLYEAILNVKLDRRNFSNKIIRLGILEKLDEQIVLKNKLEANLYKFNEEKYNELKKTSSGFKFEF
jgi:8-oxo-dGTP diphosphatase